MRSSNCLVDSRWIIKLSSWGLSTVHRLRTFANEEERFSCEELRETTVAFRYIVFLEFNMEEMQLIFLAIILANNFKTIYNKYIDIYFKFWCSSPVDGTRIIKSSKSATKRNPTGRYL